MSKWHIFFACITAVIVVAMMLPAFFGLQEFTQWGGMYTDGWCAVNAESAVVANAKDPLPPGAEMKRILAGDMQREPIVWYPPMQSEQTCIAFARSWCGVQAPGTTWKVQSAFPFFRGAFLVHEKDICALPNIPSFSWFQQ